MTETAKKYLSDIQTAITLIEEFTLEILHFNDYVSDRKTQSAVERQLAIIGEAINRLKQTNPDVILMHDVQIISFRNRLIHAYDAIDNSIVWAVLKNHLPLLKVEVNVLLEN
jgi:uncharacterized protein with HEPN domain